MYYQTSPAKTDKSLEIASIPTSIHFALPLEFIVSHCFTHKNNSLDCFYLRSLYFTSTYIGPCTAFFKKPVFQPYTDSKSKKAFVFNAWLLGYLKIIPEIVGHSWTKFWYEKTGFCAPSFFVWNQRVVWFVNKRDFFT